MSKKIVAKNITDDPGIKKSRVSIYRSNGIIEAWHVRQPTSRCAVLLPPHPMYGGTIANSILKIINDAFVECGFNTLRINFRGVGLSQGDLKTRQFDLQDTLEALDWIVADNVDPTALWVGGFGYGGYVAIHASMRKPGLSGFLAVSPQVNHPLDFNSLTPCPGGLIVTGGKDNLASTVSIYESVSSLSKKKGTNILIKEIEEADHMYKGCTQQLHKVMLDYMLQQFATAEPLKGNREFG
jgi:alpha/beta superfamily hydrolase